ncbi:MAG: M23 family metallopeptidase [Campylobacterales bacterium]
MRRSRGLGKVAFMLVLIVIITGIFFMSNSEEFEQNPPVIDIDQSIQWNGKEPIVVSFSDDSGIKNYKISALDGDKVLTTINENLQNSTKSLSVDVDLRRWQNISNDLKLEISVTDSSKGNMLSGNTQTQTVDVIIDRKKPILSIIDRSYGITKGGSAIIIFKAQDDNLKDIKIEANGREFMPQKFLDDNHYISLVAWSIHDNGFKVTISATDKAGNKAITPVNFFLKDKQYKTSNITIKESFIEGKITTLLEETGGDTSLPLLQRFKLVNEEMRKQNYKTIEEVTSKIDKNYVVKNFQFNPINPLKNGAAVSSFGTYRSYQYNGQKISDSYHMGLDLASTQNADLYSDNSSYVSFAGFNGIYGNTIILYHGLGLSTLYSHCSQMYVDQGENIPKDTLIGKTGITGLALGDHLHFGVIVQGVEVRPEEWMDSKWLSDNIFSIIDSSKQIISQGS